MARVWFKVQGSHAIGMGHVYRSLELADTFVREGLNVDRFYCNDDAVSLATISQAGYAVRACYANEGRPLRSLVEDAANECPAALVLDQPEYVGPFLGALRCSGSGTRTIGLDYGDMTEPNLDFMINLHNHDPKRKRPACDNIEYREGLEYAIIREVFDRFAQQKKHIRDVARDVLVCFGGSDTSGNTMRVLQALGSIARTALTIHLVIGPNCRGRERLRRHAGSLSVESHIYESVADMGFLMHTCDLGIHGAGTMMLEMACVGKPSIVVPQTGAEQRFADAFVSRGVVKVAGLGGATVQKQFASELLSLIGDAEGRERMSRAGKALVDGRGRFRIAQLVKACIADAAA